MKPHKTTAIGVFFQWNMLDKSVESNLYFDLKIYNFNVNKKF